MSATERRGRVKKLTAPVVRVAIYARISEDWKNEARGVKRQIALARQHIANRKSMGWVEVQVFDDNDVSALSGAYREKYDLLCRAVRRGEFDVIVVYAQARLWRNRGERAEGIEMLRHARVSLSCVRGMDLDMTSAQVRSIASQMGEQDTLESEVKAERVRDQKFEAAEQGRYLAGGYRPFGFVQEFDRPSINPKSGKKQKRSLIAMYPDPVEGPIVVDMADRFERGESLGSIAWRLNNDGITTTVGKPFIPATVRRILASAVISGRRETVSREDHRGKARPIGTIVADGDWEGIIDTDQSDRIRQIIMSHAAPPSLARTLLSGVLRCGLCGKPMVSRARNQTGRYVCAKVAGRGGCGGIVTLRLPADGLVRFAILVRLNSPWMGDRLSARRSLGADPSLRRRVEADEASLEQLGADRYDPDIAMTHGEYVANRRKILARLEPNRAKLDESTQSASVRPLVEFRGNARTAHQRAADMGRRWDEMTDAERRPLVLALIDRIDVKRAGLPRGSKRFDTDRFVIHWRDWATGDPDSPEDVGDEIKIA